MSSLIKRFYGSRAAVYGVILTADVLLVISLLVLGYCWWETKTTLTVWGHVFPIQWRDNRLLFPVGFLLLHGLATYGAESLDRARRLGLFRFPIVLRLILMYVSVMTTVILAEAVLRHTSMEIRLAPIVLASRQQGVERYHREMLADPDLAWKFEPGSSVYGGRINSLGFRDREVDPVKADGTHRVICFGDSVTAQGQPCYAQYLNDLLTNAPPGGGKWEAFSMGVYGYSSIQGLRLFELRGKQLKPDIVTVSFGRNDHTLDKADRVRLGVRLSPFTKGVVGFFSQRTIGRLLLHAADRRHVWTAPKDKASKEGEREIRVPPEDFRNTIREFVKEIRAIGATPILVTAARRAIPYSYVEGQVARSQEEFERGHDEYAQIIRDVAKETGSPLVDLRKTMADPKFDGCFARDAIHLDFYDSEGSMVPGSKEQPGLRFVARSLYEAIQGLYAEPNHP